MHFLSLHSFMHPFIHPFIRNIQDAVKRGDQLDLTDNSDPYKWRVCPPSGLDMDIPSVCFVIPAPDVDAQEIATRLDICYWCTLLLSLVHHWICKMEYYYLKQVFARFTYLFRLVSKWVLFHFSPTRENKIVILDLKSTYFFELSKQGCRLQGGHLI